MQPEVRMARYVEALERHRGGRLSCIEAAELLGISERHFRRLRERYEAAGGGGLDRSVAGRASGRRTPGVSGSSLWWNNIEAGGWDRAALEYLIGVPGQVRRV